jgi:hypothetical protein
MQPTNPRNRGSAKSSFQAALSANRIQLPAMRAQAAELRLPNAHQMPAGSAVERPARASGEVDHLFELIVLHAKRAAHRCRLSALIGLRGFFLTDSQASPRGRLRQHCYARMNTWFRFCFFFAP